MPMDKAMHEWKMGTLHSGSKHGPVVTNQKQAVAIGMHEDDEATEKKKKIGHELMKRRGK